MRPALAAHLRRLPDRLVAVGRGGDEDGVDPSAARDRDCLRYRVGAIGELDRLGAEGAGKREPAFIEIDADHAAALCPEQLHGDQADQAQAGDGDGFTERRRREPDPLQCDRADHGERSCIIAHRIRQLCAEVCRHRNHLGMLSVRDDAIADLETADATADSDDPTDVRITERQRLVELRAHPLDRRFQPVGTHLVQHVADLVRLLARLVDPVRPPEVHGHALGAGRHQRAPGLDQQMAGANTGGGYVDRAGLPIGEVLEDLLHVVVGWARAMGSRAWPGPHRSIKMRHQSSIHSKAKIG